MLKLDRSETNTNPEPEFRSMLGKQVDANLELIYEGVDTLRRNLVLSPPGDLQTWQSVVTFLNNLLSPLSAFQNPAFMPQVRRGPLQRIAQEASELNVWAALMAGCQNMKDLRLSPLMENTTTNSEAEPTSKD